MAKGDNNPLTKGEFDGFLKKDFTPFREEFTSFKAEMYEFKDEMYEFKDEMYEFKAEMYEFKDEMLDFKAETQNNFDNLARMISDLRQEMKMSFAAYRRHGEQLADHETRIRTLEASA